MHNFKLTFAPLLIIAIKGQAQELKTINNHSYVSGNVTSAVYGFCPRYTFGYITPINERWMIGLEIGYGVYDLLGKQSQIHQGIENDYWLYEFRPSIFHILNPKNEKTKTYIAAELFYINQKDQFVNNTETLKDERYINNSSNLNSSYLRYDRADYLRQKSGLNFNFGALVDLWGNFGFNINCGIGIRNRRITYSNVINPEEFRPPSLEDNNHYYFTSPIHLAETGNRFGANVNIDFKLIYKI